MRHALLSGLAWLAALQSWRPPSAGLDDFARALAIASVLGTVTVLVYRLGVWRQEMENTKQNVLAETKQHREESTANFERVERRLEAIDHSLSMLAEDGSRSERWRRRTTRRLEQLEQRSVQEPSQLSSMEAAQ